VPRHTLPRCHGEADGACHTRALLDRGCPPDKGRAAAVGHPLKHATAAQAEALCLHSLPYDGADAGRGCADGCRACRRSALAAPVAAAGDLAAGECSSVRYVSAVPSVSTAERLAAGACMAARPSDNSCRATWQAHASSMNTRDKQATATATHCVTPNQVMCQQNKVRM